MKPTPQSFPGSVSSFSRFQSNRIGVNTPSPTGPPGRAGHNRSISSTSLIIRRKNRPANPARTPSTETINNNSNNNNTTEISNGEFVSSKVIVGLSCEPEETVIKFNFSSPFRGVIQAGPANTKCKIKGDGRKMYSLGVPHASCGTKYVSSTGSFFNTLFIRYHPSLELEGDQLKSIVCKFGTGSFFVG